MKAAVIFAMACVAIAVASCSSRPSQKERLVTIIDMGTSNRIEIGHLLGVVNQHSPKIIGLDFFLLPDSLAIDSVLVKEITSAKNLVQIVSLHTTSVEYNDWDSLEISHPKFVVKKHGFGNVTTEDSVLIAELPMKQSLGTQDIYAFGYVVAHHSFGVSSKYKDNGYKEFSLDLDFGNYQLIRNHDLLSGNFNKEDITDKIVLIGYIGDNNDYFYLDDSKARKVNSVEVHAAIIDEILARNPRPEKTHISFLPRN